MPNICRNSLTITPNDAATLNTERLRKALLNDAGEFSFEVSVPSDNCSDDWGTKWDARNAEVTFTDNLVSAQFLTANAPPVAWMQKVSGSFPELTFRVQYFDVDLFVSGDVVAIEGELVRDIDDDEFIPMVFRILHMGLGVDVAADESLWDRDRVALLLESGQPAPKRLLRRLTAYVRWGWKLPRELRKTLIAGLREHPVAPASEFPSEPATDDSPSLISRVRAVVSR